VQLQTIRKFNQNNELEAEKYFLKTSKTLFVPSRISYDRFNSWGGNHRKLL
jgi:hypothetical protein